MADVYLLPYFFISVTADGPAAGTEGCLGWGGGGALNHLAATSPLPVTSSADAALGIDPTSGKITGTAKGPGVAVFIVTAGFEEDGAFLYDARAVMVRFR